MGLWDPPTEDEKALERELHNRLLEEARCVGEQTMLDWYPYLATLRDEATAALKKARKARRKGDFRREDELMAKAVKRWAKYGRERAHFERIALDHEWDIELKQHARDVPPTPPTP